MAARDNLDAADAETIRQALEALEESTQPDVFMAALESLLEERLANPGWSHPAAEAFLKLLQDASGMRQASYVLHDVRSQLIALDAYARMCRFQLERVLKEVPRGSPSLVAAVAAVHEELDDIAKVADSIIDIAQDAPGAAGRRHGPAELRPVVERTCRMASRRMEAKLTLQPPPLVTVRSPTPDLTRVLFNLVTNADDAIRHSGVGGHIEVRSWSSATTAFVEVWDDGPGLPQDDHEALFDLFHTTKADGHGVGLAASKALVSRWGGAIELESNAETGTTFRISIPVVPPTR